jgi:hypothetical protein
MVSHTRFAPSSAWLRRSIVVTSPHHPHAGHSVGVSQSACAVTIDSNAHQPCPSTSSATATGITSTFKAMMHRRVSVRRAMCHPEHTSATRTTTRGSPPFV